MCTSTVDVIRFLKRWDRCSVEAYIGTSFLGLSNFIQLYMDVSTTLQLGTSVRRTREVLGVILHHLLLGSPLPLVAHALSHHPLVWFPDFSSLVSSFGLEKNCQ